MKLTSISIHNQKTIRRRRMVYFCKIDIATTPYLRRILLQKESLQFHLLFC